MSEARVALGETRAAPAAGGGAPASVSESPRLDAEVLLAFVLKRERAMLIASGDELLSDSAREQFQALIEQRARGVPVAYLTGRREFWSLDLGVDEHVLVPRPETEGLVERVLTLPAGHQPWDVLDLGTGSGAIALALAKERPSWRITATDVSPLALDRARANAERLGLARIEWRLGSWFEALASPRGTSPGDALPGGASRNDTPRGGTPRSPVTFDLIVCNPPYIAAGDPHLAALHAEPALALTAGATGLEAFEAIIPAAPRFLARPGRIFFEHGAGQSREIANLLERNGFHHVTSHADFAGLPRITEGSI